MWLILWLKMSLVYDMSILESRFYLVQCFSRKVAQANMHTYLHTHINANKEDIWPSGSNNLG